ncbi:MAG: ABC transporter substrate-binding protein [Chloroflexota bacterium]
MKQRPRFAALAATVAILAAACGSSSVSPSAVAPSAAASEESSAALASAAASAAASQAAAATPTPTVPPGGPVQIKWFCCLGGGDDTSTEKVFKQQIAEFNKTHPNIKVVYDHTAYEGARQAFAVKLASGNPPDVVGPLGVGGAAAFDGQWLDLQSYVDKAGIDLTQYDQSMVDLYKSGGQGLLGIPFAIYPSELYYQPEMFDEAELEYPPATYGEQYKMPDGSMVEWNYDTARQVAMLLTLDKSGKNATEPGFDPNSITQYGFEPQRDDLRQMAAADFGTGRLVADDGKTAQIPEPWAAAWKWVYDGIWKDHFIMSDKVFRQPGFNGGGTAFNSGKVAMMENFLWSVCCITEAGGKWDLAALPAYNGKTTAALNVDTFRITKGTKHPDEAFEFLKYLVVGDARPKLLNAISGFPALKSDQANFFTQLEQQKDDKGKPLYPAGVNWDVVTQAIPLSDVDPNFEAPMPNYNKSLDVLVKYLTRWTGQAGLNMDTELANLKTDLQAAFDQAK